MCRRRMAVRRGGIAPSAFAIGALTLGLLTQSGCAVNSLATEVLPASSTPITTDSGAAVASAAPTGTPSQSQTPVPTSVSPFTGLPTQPDQPVLLVKMDNTTYAQPHAGLTHADLVYLEPVEYGMTRIAAVFSSFIPTRIGPVRSARITDIDLAAQFGNPALAFSGAQHRMYPVLQAAPIELVSPTVAGKGFSRDSDRRAPYNLFLDGNVALARAPKASTATDIGFTFSASPPPGGTPATHARAVWPSSSATFDYDPATGLYDIKLNGGLAGAEEDPGSQHAATVILQFVNTPDSVFHDKNGGITPRAEVVGSGTAIVLRDGMAYDVTWSRPNPTSKTTFTLASGQPMPFKPGQEWIALASTDREARIRASVRVPSDTTPTSASASAAGAASPANSASQGATSR
jgi:hypothetical protein